jgi:PAS domain S-box-containing protein
METKSIQAGNEIEQTRAAEFFREHKKAVYKRTDKIFAVLLPIQWLAGIIAAYLLTPMTWNGVESNIHPHIWVALIGGGIITSLPMYLIFAVPGAAITRNVIAVSQMLMSGVLIHISGGHIETHFHIFGSLAFLACYRDWRVLIPATLVTAADHLLRGWLYPLSIYGFVTENEWRWIEHAGWVIFTDTFLIISCLRSVKEMREIANRAAAYTSSEARYRAIVEQTTDAIVLIDPETLHVIDCNEAFSHLIGCETIDEAKTLSGFDFTTVSRGELEKITKFARKRNSPVKGESIYQRRDKSYVQVDITSNLIEYNGKQAFCLNSKDITERKRDEEEMNRLALVAQKTQNSVIVSNPAGEIQWVNDGFTRLTGFEMSEVLGRNPAEILCGRETSGESLAELVKSVIANKPFECELYCYKKNGEGYWASMSLMPINDDAGNLLGFISIEMDVTERRSMENELRRAHDELEHRVAERTAELVEANNTMQIEVGERKRAEVELSDAKEFLSDVIDNVPNLIFVKDREGRFTLVNRALAELYGTTVEDIVGKTVTDFKNDSSSSEQIKIDDWEVFEKGLEKIIPEEKFTDVHGDLHWFHTVKRPLAIGDRNVRHLLGIATDLTERKILESQLRHSQKLESIGQLAAGIAHEINTPTQYVGDNARFMRDAFTDIDSVLKKYAEFFEVARNGKIEPEFIAEIQEEIENADLKYLCEEVPNAIQQSLEGVTRIAKIVQSMKEFAHPGTKDKTAADLNRAIESTITVARNEWKYVAELETYFDETLPTVPCLLGEFNQVVLNMIINATHAIGNVVGDGANGKGKITVTTKKIDDDWAEIRIGDSGTGIPPEIRGKIFDPFFTTKEVGKGTGQGLAISHAVIVEKHNGQLTFETEMGHGTTFIIRLPVSDRKTSNLN